MRLAVAGHRVLSEAEASAALDPRGLDLPARPRLAVSVAMALMTRPGELDDAQVSAVRGEFDRSELIEMTLDTMKWNAQKPSVALGVDVEVRPGELTDLVFDADGNWVRPR